MSKKTYDWRKTFKKFGIDLLIVGLTGAIVVWQNNPKYIILVPIAKALLDYVKHK